MKKYHRFLKDVKLPKLWPLLQRTGRPLRTGIAPGCGENTSLTVSVRMTVAVDHVKLLSAKPWFGTAEAMPFVGETALNTLDNFLVDRWKLNRPPGGENLTYS